MKTPLLTEGMRRMRSIHRPMSLLLALLLAVAVAPACAETGAESFPPPPLAPLAMTAVDGPNVFTSEHSGTFNGRAIRYQATVAQTVIEDPGRVPAANLYSFSYVAAGIAAPAS